jgi:hypothetical protein
MTYEEVSAQLVGAAGENDLGRAIRREEISTTALYFVPVGWFVAFASASTLFCGIYEEQDLRLVGTRQYRFDELTPESLDVIINRAREKLLNWKLGIH